jgi:hypothetical protein
MVVLEILRHRAPEVPLPHGLRLLNDGGTLLKVMDLKC